MDKNVIIDIDELKNLKSQINIKGNDLVILLNKIIKCTEETKESFYTLTGEEFRTQMIDCLNKEIKYIQDNYLIFVNDLNLIINNYTKLHDSMSVLVQK